MGNSPNIARSARGRFVTAADRSKAKGRSAAPTQLDTDSQHLDEPAPKRRKFDLFHYFSPLQLTSRSPLAQPDQDREAVADSEYSAPEPVPIGIPANVQDERAVAGKDETVPVVQKPKRDRSVYKDPVANPNMTSKGNDKRVTRSKDGTSRSHSELANFFPDFEEILLGPAKLPEQINADTVFVVLGNPSLAEVSTTSAETSQPASAPLHATSQESSQATKSSTSVPTHPVDLSEHEALAATKYPDFDPLSDSFYALSHGRGERKEKSFRIQQQNWALHEKSVLDRLSDELKGPEWLKTMGISGVTESEAKKYEPKRDHFVREIKKLVKHFLEFKEEERRMKIERAELEKEAAAAADEETDDEEEDEEDEEMIDSDDQAEAEDDEVSSDEDLGAEEDEVYETAQSSPSQPSNSSYVDAPTIPPLPHRNHDQDSRKRPHSSKASGAAVAFGKGKQEHRSDRFLSSPTPVPPKEFTSFFDKPHQRAAAIQGHRRGRNVLAFGLPVPEYPPYQREFKLPADYFDVTAT